MLTTGSKLGAYEVVAQIGAGGMGEVYSARDTRLNRNVALKVLPDVFAHDAERMARFEREAKLLASLNHPNIAAIYGLEESGSTRALVMELVEGPTLAERIAAGPIPLDEGLPIAKQVAEALEYAHDHNVIHRDLKPANIKVTAEGTVKVLDFGLAKALADDAASESLSNSPTLSAMATRQGVILGTAAYMSPEQARGKQVDKRTDIWAFGAVLYEMLTGRSAFKGEDVAETLAAVVMKEAELSVLPAKTPSAIHNLLRRCLEKEPRRRVQHIGEARIVIEDVLSGAANAEVLAAQSQAVARQPVLAISVVAALAAATIASLATWMARPAPQQPAKPVQRFAITLPPGDRLAAPAQPAVALSADGSQLAYVAIRGGRQQIYLRTLDSFESKSLPGTENGFGPFFSPDGKWLGFFADQKLKKVSVLGGPAITLADASNPRGASWGNNGMIAFVPTVASAVQLVSEGGGATRPFAAFETGETAHHWPEFLPDGMAMLFVGGTTGNWTEGTIAVLQVGSGQRRKLVQSAMYPRYAASGHLVYAQGGALMAVPFDHQRLQVTGKAVPVIDDVLQYATNGDAQYSLSVTGSLVYVTGGMSAPKGTLVWVSRNGTEQPIPVPQRSYLGPRLAPDGRRMALRIDDMNSHIWLYDPSKQTLSRFMFEGKNDLNPAWTPDGKRIAFTSDKEGQQNIFWQMADGSGGLEQLVKSAGRQVPSSWSPDGQLLAYTQLDTVTMSDIWVVRLSDRKTEPFLKTRFNEQLPMFSPDGRWLAYQSDESGRFEIYVQPYPGPGGKWQISTDGGTEPVWSRNARELFYRNGKKLMSVEVTLQPNFSGGSPRMLFEREYAAPSMSAKNYDVSPDGQRFLMIKPAEESQATQTQINVVLNWFEELKRLVPSGAR